MTSENRYRNNRKSTGRSGEQAAAEYLIENNHKILERNFRSPHGEVDIISIGDGSVVFTEVKSWKRYGVEQLEYSISTRKRNRLVKTALWFLKANREYRDYSLRFDIIFIDMKDVGIRHMEHAFTWTGDIW
jgi:putative endonuclease